MQLEDIRVHTKTAKDKSIFGGSNLNHQLALQFHKNAKLRAQMTEQQIEQEKKKPYRAMDFTKPYMRKLQRQNRAILEINLSKQ
jgi:hypothetical protein